MQRIVCHSSHYGDLVKAKGRLPRIYNEVGYINIHNGGDSVSYHYWLTDHLGSVHAVVDANNGVEQAHDYTVSGVPAARPWHPCFSSSAVLTGSPVGLLISGHRANWRLCRAPQ